MAVNENALAQLYVWLVAGKEKVLRLGGLVVEELKVRPATGLNVVKHDWVFLYCFQGFI